MRESDISQVAEIEREAFPEDWPPMPFSREMSNSMSHYLVAVVAPDAAPRTTPSGGSLEPEAVLGYSGLWIVMEESHLTSIAVRGIHRRRGIGELLLIGSLEVALQSSAKLMVLEVRVSNTSAQALYQKYGFISKGIRRGYYSNNNEDAILMVAEEIQQPEYRSRLNELKEAHQSRWTHYVD